MARTPHWTDERNRYETAEGFAARMERREEIAAAREKAKKVKRNGREFTLVRLGKAYGTRS
jgi:hypothetical protein